MTVETSLFDFWDIFRNEVVGDTILFLLIGLLIIFYITNRFRLGVEIKLLLLILFLSSVFSFVGASLLWTWILAVSISGTMFYYYFAKIWKR